MLKSTVNTKTKNYYKYKQKYKFLEKKTRAKYESENYQKMYA